MSNQYLSSSVRIDINYRYDLGQCTSVLPYQYVNNCEVASQFVTFAIGKRKKTKRQYLPVLGQIDS